MSADPRGITIGTPLGPDALFLTNFRGREGISQLFDFSLEVMAENRTNIAFDKLLGQGVGFSILLSDGKAIRYWHGICRSMAQIGRDSTFTTYRMEVAPKVWLLTRKLQSRIFQHISVPDILKKVLAGFDVQFELQGTFEQRDYCVQYRETDFNFASRLMEEEGIYYFFKYTESGHQMVVGNSPTTHPAVPFSESVIYEELTGGNRPEMRIYQWEKNQELRSGKITLWDHCFELPNQHLDVERPTPETVEVGKVVHKLKLPANDSLELYEYPGGYAGRFDGVDRGGGDNAGNLQKIFQDNKRTAAIRMDQEAAQAILIRGAGNCRQFTAGHKFAVERHFNADGKYLLTQVEHSASASAGGRSGNSGEVAYSNHFTCVPLSLPFRPPQRTPRPTISGPQTATVVGPAGEEIHTDKYSRVKVQFPWDREGKRDADSSCWIRVATIWAGKGYGVIHIPRIGQEVVVDFMEGDPDQPIIIGSVYNAENMPAAKLPENKMVSGLKSATYPGSAGFNGMVCNDTKKKETVTVHAQKDMSTTVLHDDSQTIIHDRNVTIHGKLTETIDKDTTIKITAGKLNHDVMAGTADYHVAGTITEKYTANQTTLVGGNLGIGVGGGKGGGHIVIKADEDITLVTGASSIFMKKDGTITIAGKKISVFGTEIQIIGDTKLVGSAPDVLMSGGKTAKLGVGNQNIACDTSKVNVSGAAINSSAVGMHEITGALVKIN